MHTIDARCEALIGKAALDLWSEFPRDVQEKLFEAAVAANEELSHSLAVFLHDRHPRTAHPPKPTALA